jgi:hypothetical protein
MIVTFKSRAYADIVMFGDVANTLLKMMGHSGTVPSAIMAKDVPAALNRLQQAVAASNVAEASPDPDDEQEFVPSIAQRALPLIDLLKAAAAANEDVMWDS